MAVAVPQMVIDPFVCVHLASPGKTVNMVKTFFLNSTIILAGGYVCITRNVHLT